MRLPLNPFARRRLPITVLLISGLGTLVFLAVAGVLLVTLGTAASNTIGLLQDKSRLLLTSVLERTRQFVDPAEAQAEFVAQLIESGQVGPDRPQQLFGTLRVALAATPQVAGVVYLDRDGWMIAVERGTEAPELEVTDWRIDPVAVAAMADAERRQDRSAFWGTPLYSKAAGTTVINLRRPVRRGEQFLGLVASSITVNELSRFIVSLESEIGQNAFILYDRDRVLAHRVLEFDLVELDRGRPLPAVDEVGDPVLANIWRTGYEDRRLVAGKGHADHLLDPDVIYLYVSLDHYSDAPWTVGSYFAEDDIGSQFFRLAWATGVAIVVLLLALGFAVLLGRKVSRPIAELANAAVAMRDLDLDHVPMLRRSRLREIDQAAAAFNAMVGALQVFALYVPKKLVQALIDRRRASELRSESREVTVLFTDISGFTGRVEELSAEETAAFLNHHFNLVTSCIEEEDGIVDKYIGDAVMALWNALEDQPDHADRAVRAAARIAQALEHDNAGRTEPVKLRIGIHTGPVVVGNIGTPVRMNFTVVGDAVNIAQRLQALGRELRGNPEVAVLISGETARRTNGAARLESLGARELRGREEAVEIFRLLV